MVKKKWTETEERALQEALNQGLTHKEAGEMLGRSEDSVKFHCRVKKILKQEKELLAEPLEVTEQEVKAEMPEPVDPDAAPPIVAEMPKCWFVNRYTPFVMDDPGIHFLLMDLHIPYHERAAIELAVAKAKKQEVKSVIINGDCLDCGEISDHLRDRDEPSYIQEIYMGRNFLAWLREQFPKARIIYKEGNHEDRLNRYLIKKGFALRGLDGMNFKTFLKMPDQGIEWVGDKRVIQLGQLNVLHGHEYRGISTPVNPARGLYLKARSVAMCGHFHRSSEHFDRNVRQKMEAAWSVGCLCNLKPRYCPINNWNHGFAFVVLESDGSFSMLNKKVLDGKVI